MSSRVALPQSRRNTQNFVNESTPELLAVKPILEWTQAQQLPEWDVILIGDGSSSKWEVGAGWACTLIERQTGRREVFWGGMNLGTVPIAEIMAYVHAMLWYSAEIERRSKTHRKIRVLVICDNKPLMQQGEQLARGARTPGSLDSNRALWRALIGYQQEGFSFAFHWIERVTIALNRYADTLASAARLAAKAVQTPCHTRTKCTLDVYDVNIDEHEPLLPYKPPKKERRHATERTRDQETRPRRAAGD